MKLENVLKNRKSYRNYSGDIDMVKVEELLKIAQRTATSINGQQISLILVTEKEKIEEIAKINHNQSHIKNAGAVIIFTIDYNRASEVMEDELVINNYIESLIVGSIDAGLMAQSVDLLMQSNDIATCFIGGIRNNMLGIKEMLNLTGNTLPILGITLGNEVIDKTGSNLRPRVDYNSFVFENSYDEAIVRKKAVEYNEELNTWWENQGETNHRSYGESMNQFYSKNYMEGQIEQIKEAGFLNEIK